jgi:hypothetical protein
MSPPATITNNNATRGVVWPASAGRVALDLLDLLNLACAIVALSRPTSLGPAGWRSTSGRLGDRRATTSAAIEAKVTTTRASGQSSSAWSTGATAATD